MDAVITALTTGLTSTVFFAVLEDVVPLLIVLIPFCLGYRVLRRVLSSSYKGKIKV